MKLSSNYQLILLLAVLLTINVILFISGYRISPDDTNSHFMSLRPLSEHWNAWLHSLSNPPGRVNSIIWIPLDIFGAYISDNFYFRIIYTTVYFGSFVLLSIYISIIVQNLRISFVILIVFFSFHPLIFHIDPNSYPLHNTVPVFLIVLFRLIYVNVYELPKYKSYFLLYPFYAISVFSSEYTMLFACGLVMVEYGTLLFREAGVKFIDRIKGVYSYKLVLDTITLFILFSIYIYFRVRNPTDYSGVLISDNFSVYRVGVTMWGHVMGGLSLTHLKAAMFAQPVWAYVIAVGIGLVTWLATVKLPDGSYTSRSIVGVIALLAAALFFNMLPIALTGKYQNWCVDAGFCTYLSSRIAYLFLIPIIALIGLAILQKTAVVLTDRRKSIAGIALGSIAALTMLHNLNVAAALQNYVSVFDRLRLMACIEPKDQREFLTDHAAARRINIHPNFDVDAYLSRYLEHLQSQGECDDLDAMTARSRYLESYAYTPGTKVFAGKEGSTIYLGKGWSPPESWGVWSNGPEAQIVLVVPGAQPRLVLQFTAMGYAPEGKLQNVSVRFNGTVLAELTVGRDRQDYTFPIDESLLADRPDGLNKIVFHIADPVSPEQLGLSNDSRQLGLGLISFRLDPAN